MTNIKARVVATMATETSHGCMLYLWYPDSPGIFDSDGGLMAPAMAAADRELDMRRCNDYGCRTSIHATGCICHVYIECTRLFL